MKKKMTLILGALACGIGIWAVSFWAFGTIDKPLIEFYYSSGGDMRGGYRYTTVKSLDNDYALIVTGGKAWHGLDAVAQEYKVPKAVLSDIQGIFNKHKMGNSDKAFKSPFKVLDKGSSSYTFEFENKRVRFDSEQMLSEDTRLGVKEILTYISAQCKKGEKLPGLPVPNPNAEANNLKRPVEGKLAMEVFDYHGKIMNVRIANGLKNQQEIPLSYKLYKQGDEQILISEKQMDKKAKVSANSSNEIEYELPERLQAGEYVLKIANLETRFVLK